MGGPYLWHKMAKAQLAKPGSNLDGSEKHGAFSRRTYSRYFWEGRHTEAPMFVNFAAFSLCNLRTLRLKP